MKTLLPHNDLKLQRKSMKVIMQRNVIMYFVYMYMISGVKRKSLTLKKDEGMKDCQITWDLINLNTRVAGLIENVSFTVQFCDVPTEMICLHTGEWNRWTHCDFSVILYMLKLKHLQGEVIITLYREFRRAPPTMSPHFICTPHYKTSSVLYLLVYCNVGRHRDIWKKYNMLQMLADMFLQFHLCF